MNANVVIATAHLVEVVKVFQCDVVVFVVVNHLVEQMLKFGLLEVAQKVVTPLDFILIHILNPMQSSVNPGT